MDLRTATARLAGAGKSGCGKDEILAAVERAIAKVAPAAVEQSPVRSASQALAPKIGSGANQGAPPAGEPSSSSWAKAYGEDRFGRYADVEVPGTLTGFRVRFIPAGTFTMGSPEGEDGRFAGEGPQHQVTISKGYWMAESECTQAVYKAVTGRNPSRFEGVDRPVDRVSWEDAQVFLTKINRLIPGFNARLPTEAEWEHAARAGTMTARHGPLKDVAWCGEQAQPGTHPVKQKQANAWGLHDMLGNVYEWTQDRNGSYTSRAESDPGGPGVGRERVIRGGAWNDHARRCRAAFRAAERPENGPAHLGFRLVRAE